VGAKAQHVAVASLNWCVRWLLRLQTPNPLLPDLHFQQTEETLQCAYQGTPDLQDSQNQLIPTACSKHVQAARVKAGAPEEDKEQKATRTGLAPDDAGFELHSLSE
jgi:hypothetical protein